MARSRVGRNGASRDYAAIGSTKCIFHRNQTGILGDTSRKEQQNPRRGLSPLDTDISPSTAEAGSAEGLARISLPQHRRGRVPIRARRSTCACPWTGHALRIRFGPLWGPGLGSLVLSPFSLMTSLFLVASWAEADMRGPSERDSVLAGASPRAGCRGISQDRGSSGFCVADFM